jgi:hypothetical protein
LAENLAPPRTAVSALESLLLSSTKNRMSLEITRLLKEKLRFTFPKKFGM